ncbi:MAG: exonuclease domain-containing protein, partial [Lachnospiraceae bacterium]|nr:exonuclease domain-containing protein [Lachnospiraceae bacterium]
MNYIVFDLEWNQCPYGKGQENERIPFEIIEIGAVKLNSEKQIIDQYQVLIRPQVYKKLHFRTKEIIQLDMKELEQGQAFYKAIREFLRWCGEDYRFCTWGNSDLLELQRNMKYYGVLQLLKGPIPFLDAQKLFSLDYEDGESRKSLEYAVDFLQIEKRKDFHRALADAWYTAQVFSMLHNDVADVFYSIDCYQNPQKKEEE